MMKNPGEYTKGPMGHMLDMRKAMALLATTAAQWCKAFDAGDVDAMGHLTTVLGECVQDVSDASKGVDAASGRPVPAGRQPPKTLG